MVEYKVFNYQEGEVEEVVMVEYKAFNYQEGEVEDICLWRRRSLWYIYVGEMCSHL